MQCLAVALGQFAITSFPSTWSIYRSTVQPWFQDIVLEGCLKELRAQVPQPIQFHLSNEHAHAVIPEELEVHSQGSLQVAFQHRTCDLNPFRHVITNSRCL